MQAILQEPRAHQFLGFVGTIGNGQSVLVTKSDVDSVFNEMLRMHKKQVRKATGVPRR